MLNNLQEILHYRPAALQENKSREVVFYAYNPEIGKLDKKRIRINQIKKVSERRKYATELIKRLNTNLENGWNPFIDLEAIEISKILK